MWDRTILKQNAKTALSGRRYWTAFAVCLVYSLILNAFNITDSFSAQKVDIFSPGWFEMYAGAAARQTSFWKLLVFIFVALPLAVGMARYFVRNRFGNTDFSAMFSGFSQSYGSTVGGMFTTAGIIFLWTLLLIIPGIVKRLEYCMVRFILSDNPAISGTRAREISSRMTYGEKGSVLVLYLSFLGWYILAGIVFAIFAWLLWPIGVLASAAASALVWAYQEATFAELYIFMRDRAIRTGVVSPGELGLAV